MTEFRNAPGYANALGSWSQATDDERQQWLEVLQRMRRDGVAIVKTGAEGKAAFVDPFDFYTEPPK